MRSNPGSSVDPRRGPRGARRAPGARDPRDHVGGRCRPGLGHGFVGGVRIGDRRRHLRDVHLGNRALHADGGTAADVTLGADVSTGTCGSASTGGATGNPETFSTRADLGYTVVEQDGVETELGS